MTDLLKQATIEKLWLMYYNDTLFSKGVISEDQYCRMQEMICRRGKEKA